MKKWCFCFILICFLLAACNAVEDSSVSVPENGKISQIGSNAAGEDVPSASDRGDSVQTPQIKPDAISDLSFTATNMDKIIMRINPHWEILMNDDGLIEAINPLNSDAEDLLSSVDVTQMTPTEGIPLILQEAQSKGYLESGDTVDFQLVFSQASQTDMMMQAADIYRVFWEYIGANDLDAVEVIGTWEAETELENRDPTADSSVEAQIEKYLSDKGLEYANYKQVDSGTIEGYDPDGNLVYSKIVWENGGGIEFLYSNGVEIYSKWITEEDTMEYFSPNGILEYHTCITGDGSVQEFFYSNGEIKCVIIHSADGSTSTTCNYDINGQTVSITTCSDGTHIEQVYYPDGTQSYSKNRKPDGHTFTTKWFPDGVVAMSREDLPDGNYNYFTRSEDRLSEHSYDSQYGESYTTYYEDGTCASYKYTHINGEYGEFTYDQNGNETYSHYYRDGIEKETIYNEDRSYTIYYSYSDGTKLIQYVNADGELIGGVDIQGQSFICRNGQIYYDE